MSPSDHPPVKLVQKPVTTTAAADYSPTEMLSTWQYYALILMFIGSAQSGLLVIANAAPHPGQDRWKTRVFCEKRLDDCRLWRFDQCPRPGRFRAFIRTRSGGQMPIPSTTGFGGFFIGHALYYQCREHTPFIFSHRGRLLAVWRGVFRSCPPLRLTSSVQKILGVNYGLCISGLGIGVFNALDSRLYQGQYRFLFAVFLYLGSDINHSGHPLPVS